METLDKCFENVCELDLIFHVDKVGKAQESFRAEYLKHKVFVSRNEHCMRSDMICNFLSKPLLFPLVLQQLTPDILFFHFFVVKNEPHALPMVFQTQPCQTDERLTSGVLFSAGPQHSGRDGDGWDGPGDQHE